jgi:hypothetical protein
MLQQNTPVRRWKPSKGQCSNAAMFQADWGLDGLIEGLIDTTASDDTTCKKEVSLF